MQRERVVGLGQDAHKILLRQRAELHADRQAALQFGQQVRRFGDVEGARGDEQDVVGVDRPVLGAHRRALDQRQQVTLHALAAYVAAAHIGAGTDLVDLVEKHDAVLLHRVQRGAGHRLVIQQLVGFLGHQDLVALGHRQLAPHRAAPEGLAENVAERGHAHAHAGLAGDIKHRHAARRIVLQVQLDLAVVKLARAQFFAKHLAGLLARVLAGNRLDHALFGLCLGGGLHVFAHLGAGLDDRRIHQVAHDLLDVAPDVAHLGELRGLDLDERRARQLGEAAADLGFAHAGRPDHQDVFRIHLFADLVGQLLAPPAVAQRHGHGALGVLLADDEAIKLRDNLAWSQVGHFSMVSTVRLPLV